MFIFYLKLSGQKIGDYFITEKITIIFHQEWMIKWAKKHLLPCAGPTIVTWMIITYRNIAVLNIPSFTSLIYDEQLFVVNLKIPNASFIAIYLPSTLMNLLMNRNVSKEDWSKGDLQKQKETCQKKPDFWFYCKQWKNSRYW